MTLAKIEHEEIVIRIPLTALPNAARIAWDNQFGFGNHSYYVDDLTEFSKSFVLELNREDEIGDTVLHRVFDSVVISLTENGELGFNDSVTPL